MDLRYLAIIFTELFVSSYCQRCHICLVDGFMKFSVCCSISMFCVTSCTHAFCLTSIRSLDIHVRVKQLFIFLTNSKGELLTSEHLMLSVIKSYRQIGMKRFYHYKSNKNNC